MRTSEINIPTILATALALVLGFTSGITGAQISPEDTGYLSDQRGTVVRSDYNLCWHTGSGPATYTPECDSAGATAPLIQALEQPRPPSVPVSPKSVANRIALNADTLFDFDKVDLRPAGKLALDHFLAKMRGIDTEVIVAIGHTDRFGSGDYNQSLSERRAASVKAYLLSIGVGPDRVRSEGRGETQPVTRTGECGGAKSKKVIACLQPDRRVDIEVVGTRIAD